MSPFDRAYDFLFNFKRNYAATLYKLVSKTITDLRDLERVFVREFGGQKLPSGIKGKVLVGGQQ